MLPLTPSTCFKNCLCSCSADSHVYDCASASSSLASCVKRGFACVCSLHAQMFRPCYFVNHRMAPPVQASAKQNGYVPLRAASPPRDSSTGREYPLNRRVSPGVEHRRPLPRGNPKGKTTLAPGQVMKSNLCSLLSPCPVTWQTYLPRDVASSRS